MATYKILYWRDIPAQIKVEDDEDELSVPLDQRFMQHIDDVATRSGLAGSDDYMAQWEWTEELERDGSAEEVAAALRAELEATVDW